VSARVDIAIVGGQKCGTTTLYRSLARHPSIFAPNAKESRAFTLDDDARDTALQALYSGQGNRRGLHAYAHAWSMDSAITSMYRHNPAMHLVALTRDPVERIWSAYRFAVANGWETLDLADALAAESGRRQGTRIERVELQYVRNSQVQMHVARLHRHFPESNVHVLKMADLGDASGDTLTALLTALGLEGQALAPLPAQNTASNPKSTRLQRWILGESRLKRWVRHTVPPHIKSRIHQHLTAPVLSWNRLPAAPSVLTDDARALINAALDPS
jgi:hypothetical protein